MFDHAEVALHDVFGDALYWQARRSMRFSSGLVELAASFRMEYLNCTDETDGTIRPDDWTKEKVSTT
jgi:peptide-O-fucosyltransferase